MLMNKRQSFNIIAILAFTIIVMLLVSFPLHPDIYSLPSGHGYSFSPAGAGGIGTGAATNSKCSSNQIDIGDMCTSKAEVSKQIISITQGIIESHRGQLTVDSADGQGTTLTVRLPLASVPEPVRRVAVAAG